MLPYQKYTIAHCLSAFYEFNNKVSGSTSPTNMHRHYSQFLVDMGRQWLVACMLLSMAMAVRAYSSGAPAAACARIYPEGHNGTSLSLSSSPFVLDISQLYNQLGNIYYTPGYSYTRKKRMYQYPLRMWNAISHTRLHRYYCIAVWFLHLAPGGFDRVLNTRAPYLIAYSPK